MVLMEEAVLDTDARHIVSFSGGKDSTALGILLMEKFPQVKS